MSNDKPKCCRCGGEGGWERETSCARSTWVQCDECGDEKQAGPVARQDAVPLVEELASALREAQSWIRQFASVRSSDVDNRIQFALDRCHQKPAHESDKEDAELLDSVEVYLEAQGALDNRELMGPNAPSWEELHRECRKAYANLEAAIDAARATRATRATSAKE